MRYCGLHRLPSCHDQMRETVTVLGALAVAVRDMARARWDAPTVLVDPSCDGSYAGWPFVESVVGSWSRASLTGFQRRPSARRSGHSRRPAAGLADKVPLSPVP